MTLQNGIRFLVSGGAKFKMSENLDLFSVVKTKMIIATGGKCESVFFEICSSLRIKKGTSRQNP